MREKMKNTVALVVSSLTIFYYSVTTSNAADILQPAPEKTSESSPTILNGSSLHSARDESQNSAKLARGLGFKIELVDAGGYGENRREDFGYGENRREDFGYGEKRREDFGYGEKRREDFGYADNRREEFGYGAVNRRAYAGYTGGFRNFGYNGDSYEGRRFHHNRREFSGYNSAAGYTDLGYNGEYYEGERSRHRVHHGSGYYTNGDYNSRYL